MDVDHVGTRKDCFSRLSLRIWVKVIKSVLIKFANDRRPEGIAQSLAGAIKI